MPTQAIQSTAQQFLEIFDITNDLVIMKDGATSLILTVNAMNFGLLAEEEQDAIMYAYAGLLNSLNYPIEIVIRSQTKDITNYLNLLKDQEEKATDELKRVAIHQYREFVAELIRERNILDKKFYVAIPASALEMGLLPPQTVLPGVKQVDITSVERSVILDKARDILEPKRDHLVGQFGRIGLYARQLKTQEIIQLFYTSYNPEAAEGQQLTDTSNYTTPMVEAQIRQQVLQNALNNTVQTPVPTFSTPYVSAPEHTPQPVGQTQPPSAPLVYPPQASQETNQLEETALAPQYAAPMTSSAQTETNTQFAQVPAAQSSTSPQAMTADLYPLQSQLGATNNATVQPAMSAPHQTAESTQGPLDTANMEPLTPGVADSQAHAPVLNTWTGDTSVAQESGIPTVLPPIAEIS